LWCGVNLAASRLNCIVRSELEGRTGLARAETSFLPQFV
jgi:hypothetical protein